MRWVLSIINAMSLAAFLLCMSIQIPAFNRPFYSAEYDKHSVPQSIQVDKADLMQVTEKLLNYMSDAEDDLVVTAEVAGESREFFNAREKQHMVDVKNLILLMFSARNLSLAVTALTFAALFFLRGKSMAALMRTWQVFFISFLIVAASLIIFIASDFDRAFTLFHELFFSNDLWILDARTDLLVNIVPIGFFTDIAAFIGSIFAGLTAILISASSVALKLMKGKNISAK
ncbi:MAG: TIGR01906 family membrane protein [Clostridiales bacterium]|jgi:integral membrane protein (TIGR01906 family)|nr:TIGR01906 family membrane protein [Clostridiales bacterium]